MSTLQLTVEVDPDQLEFLSNNNYSLCIAKAGSSGGPAKPTVIWTGGDILPNNEFQWQDVYQVFGAVSYTVGALVESQTQRRTIQFGQTCTIDKAGNMTTATGPADPSTGSFNVTNSWKRPVNIGASCALMTPGSTTFTPIDFYVSASQVAVDDVINLTPIDQVSVWFEVEAQTGTMISDITSPKWTVDFTGSNPKSQTVSYNAAGKWQNGPVPQNKVVSTTTTTTTTTTTKPKAGYSAAQSAETVTTVTTTTTTAS